MSSPCAPPTPPAAICTIDKRKADMIEYTAVRAVLTAATQSAPVVELADTMDLGSIAQACRFKSCRAHHSEMTFGCQAAAQGAPASTAKVFLRLNLQSLRWIASLFLIKPSLTCSVAPPFQNANISLVCILVFLPMLENSRTPCLFVHFTKGRVSVLMSE